MRFVVGLGSRGSTPAPWFARRLTGQLESCCAHRWRKRLALLAASCVAAAALGALSGALTHYELPGPEPLSEGSPAVMTRLVDREGGAITSFAREKRLLLDAGDIPESFRLALIASEDSRFEGHVGIDPIGALRTVWWSLRRGRVAGGASTLTMQLAGNLFLDRSERTFARKVEEILLALELERRYSKQEILALYCNRVHFGHGLYGLEAAARFYFGKPARELARDESATLVGILPRPAGYSPVRNPDLARRRRNLVLRRMVEEGYVSAAEAERLAERPIVLASHASPPDTSEAPARYFAERVRRSVLEDFGSEALHAGGLVVRTTLDPRLQAVAERAIEEGLQRIEGQRAQAPALSQNSRLEGALVALDPRTGEVLALVGGRDFERSEFDRATQARRQPGSLFKPLVFATALGRGATLADVLIDEPTVFVDRRRPVPYQPENYELVYHGAITLRAALEESVNIATVKLADQVGPPAVIETARRVGLAGPLEPYPSLALGAFELTLLEITSAYGAFANGGLLFEPHWIASVEDIDGRPLDLAEPRVSEALDPRVAFLVNQALSGVVERGTGHAAALALPGHTLAGKTGTTDSFTDAWFVGYTPRLVVGVWVGHDDHRTLGEGATGARTALPIWIEFMREALAGEADEPFVVPPGIVAVSIDPRTGLKRRARAGCTDTAIEYFVEGTEPLAACSSAVHARLALPYPFHRYAIDPHGSLEIPRGDLEILLAEEPTVSFDPRRGILHGEAGLQVPVRIVEPDAPAEPPPREFERSGADGRRARVVWLSP